MKRIPVPKIGDMLRGIEAHASVVHKIKLLPMPVGMYFGPEPGYKKTIAGIDIEKGEYLAPHWELGFIVRVGGKCDPADLDAADYEYIVHVSYCEPAANPKRSRTAWAAATLKSTEIADVEAVIDSLITEVRQRAGLPLSVA